MAKIKAVGISIKDDERWRVEHDLETLMNAEKIKADPKRLAKAQALAKQKMMEAASVASSVDKT